MNDGFVGPGAQYVNQIHRIAKSRGIDIPRTVGSLERIGPKRWRATNMTRNGEPVPNEIYTLDAGKWTWSKE